MEKVANTLLISGEPQTLELSSDLSKEARESITDVTRLEVEDNPTIVILAGKGAKRWRFAICVDFLPTTRAPLLVKARSRN